MRSRWAVATTYVGIRSYQGRIRPWFDGPLSDHEAMGGRCYAQGASTGTNVVSLPYEASGIPATQQTFNVIPNDRSVVGRYWTEAPTNLLGRVKRISHCCPRCGCGFRPGFVK